MRWQPTPASIRRAFFVISFFVGAAPFVGWAQPGYRPQPSYVQVGKPDPAEGQRIMEEFRGMGLGGDYYLDFQLRVMPRRGAERTISGAIWGGHNESGPATRIALKLAGSDLRLMVQDGAEPTVWQWRSVAASKVEKLDLAALFTPLAETDFTLFDLQRPYLKWPEFVYEGLAKVHGRPAYQFLLYPPADFTAKYPALTGVRIYLDSQYKGPVQTEQIGAGGAVLKTLTLQEVKKFGEQWLPQMIDLRDEATHNKTRFTVTGAALGQDFVGGVFDSAALGETVAPPPPDRITRIAP